ncbi:MAG: Uma2 family endonuclease [Bryobacteraceae bacterium]
MSTAASVLPPPLRDGDRLTRDEFLRRWDAMPDLKHAELLDGVVYLPSPVSTPHGRHHSHLDNWLGNYAARTPGCDATIDTTWIMGERDVPQPDIALMILPEYRGQSKMEGNLSSGAPEFIVEVAFSSRQRDLAIKTRLYQRAGVREYVTALVKEKRIAWRHLIDGEFQTLDADSDGIYRSRVFPGLWLDSAAFWRLDRAALLTCLDQGTATPGHSAFVRELAARRVDS